MSDIIKKYSVRSTAKERAKKVKFLYDNGSPWTFAKESFALKMKAVSKLPEPYPFFGLGNGRFLGTHMLQLQIKLLGIWVPHLCYVVSDEVLEPYYKVLLGHDFMQRYDIVLRPKKKEVVISKDAIKLGMRVRKVKNKEINIVKNKGLTPIFF